MVGAKLVLPGPKLDGASLHELIVSEEVTFTAGVPTVWMGLLDWVAAKGRDLGPLQRVAIGGSACPPVMLDRFRAHGVDVVHAWGMTETSPVGLVNWPKAGPERTGAAAAAFSAKQGRPLFGMGSEILDEEERQVPNDGIAFGAMYVRGPWVAASYYGLPPTAAHGPAGWFETGDVATMAGRRFCGT